MEAALIFPHQLFAETSWLKKNVEVFLIEDHLYFTQFKFHKQKLVLHRASMKYYEQRLKHQGFKVHYVEHAEHDNLKTLFEGLRNKRVTTIHCVEAVDYLLTRRLKRYSSHNDITLVVHRTPNFLITDEEFASMTNGKYFMANFYIQQRKKLKILLDESGGPLGGKWSFDTENRKKVGKNVSIPPIYIPRENDFVKEAKNYANQHFAENYGTCESFLYPTTHEEAIITLEDFLRHRMHSFGDYEDAIVRNESFLFHAVLTPALNIGLLTPKQIVDKVFEFVNTYHYPLNCLEGFIRQIIGWREFMRGIYMREGVFERTANSQNFSNKIPETFWTGDTGIEPIDATIKKILKTGYCHHIERLMILGNFMQLCQFHPNHVYHWFMELFIDAYDWVMVPNVYGMSQYADGGLITTKPYVSGSNYILKMSDYKKGKWCDIWDALYWRYIFKNQDTFRQNQRMNMIVSLLGKMEKVKLQRHLKVADEFLAHLRHPHSTQINFTTRR
ncbi:cryptochrome/photolyase family protein [Pseudochryseolinea flava]|uniref:Cryptochrome/photolyase family protein n=1 Tax=Pseudochryseolinea flava TaxID=2059302 RepID=A0A364Y8D3_9BACT|nr:cryptochrome/photolyase family protein [Pseudochryseolinea flava]RAW03247.1 cryptochrome/photolyase family protein [Pseudochryseolinea flava]